MQSKKMSLANVQGKLSRAEMKNVMAGTGGIVVCVKQGKTCDTSGVKCCDNGKCMNEPGQGYVCLMPC